MALALTTTLLPSWLLRRAAAGGLLFGRDTAPPAAGTACWTAFRAACRATPYYTANPPHRRAALLLADFYRDLPLFLNPSAPADPEPARLGAPWDPPLRAVALQPWFRLPPGDAEALMTPTVEALLAARPEVLAGPVKSLRAVALSALRRRWRMESLTHGVLVFTGCSRPPLRAGQRDAFWRVFGVPCYEQFRGFQGEILASECEAHCGLHVNPDIAVWEEHPDPASRELLVTSLVNLRHPAYRLATGYHGIFDYRICDCGLATPRIVWTRPALS